VQADTPEAVASAHVKLIESLISLDDENTEEDRSLVNLVQQPTDFLRTLENAKDQQAIANAMNLLFPDEQTEPNATFKHFAGRLHRVRDWDQGKEPLEGNDRFLSKPATELLQKATEEVPIDLLPRKGSISWSKTLLQCQ
jgi:hypothetical protein